MTEVRIYGEIALFNQLIRLVRGDNLGVFEFPDLETGENIPNTLAAMLGRFILKDEIFISVDKLYKAKPLAIELDHTMQITWEEPDDPFQKIAFVSPTKKRVQYVEASSHMVIPRD